jgi:hypothetical protein
MYPKPDLNKKSRNIAGKNDIFESMSGGVLV